jgi:copper transport protein
MRNPLAQALLGALLWLLALSPVPASAHAVLVETSPRDGERLDQPPAELVLRFSEPIVPIAVRLLDEHGAEVPGVTVELHGETLIAHPPTPLPEGAYLISYRITSVDGHPVAGSFVFSIGSGARPKAAALETAPDQPAQLILTVIRAIHYAALLIATGGVLFVLLVLRRSHPFEIKLRNGLCGLIALAAVSGILCLGLGGAQLAGTPLTSLAAGEPWAIGLGTTLGSSCIVMIGGLLLLALGMALQHARLARPALALGCIMALASLVLTGHAAAAPPAALSVPAVLLHVVTGAFWLGSLWPLAYALKALPGREAALLVQRFSALAVVAVALLVLAGAVLSLVQLRSLGGIVGTTYGLTWLAKIALVVLLLGVAAANRQVLTPRLHRSEARAPAALRRAIGVELALAAGILGLTSMLGQTPPPRALAAPDNVTPIHDQAHGHHAPEPMPSGSGYTVVATSGGRAALVEIVPAWQGRNRITITLFQPDGQPLVTPQASIELTLPEKGIEPLVRPLEPAGDHRFIIEDNIPFPGHWAVRVDALISDFEKLIFRFEVPVGEPGS